MDLFEYQGKQYFARYDIPVSPGGVAYTVDEAVAVAEQAGYPVVVKAQVQVGGRGKAGGIKLADNADEVRLHAGNIIGMDTEGLQANNITMHYDPNALYVEDVQFGTAVLIDPKTPPIAKIDREKGLITLFSSTGKPLVFRSGGEVANIRVHGGMSGDTILVLDDPGLRNASGVAVESAISGARAKVE